MTSKHREQLPPVDSKVLANQIEIFVRSFVLRRFRDRAMLFLVAPGHRRKEALYELQPWLDPDLCQWHTGKAGREQELWNRNASVSAVCVTGGAGFYSTLDEMDRCRPALVLVDARDTTFFLPDDYGVIACVRTQIS